MSKYRIVLRNPKYDYDFRVYIPQKFKIFRWVDMLYGFEYEMQYIDKAREIIEEDRQREKRRNIKPVVVEEYGE